MSPLTINLNAIQPKKTQRIQTRYTQEKTERLIEYSLELFNDLNPLARKRLLAILKTQMIMDEYEEKKRQQRLRMDTEHKKSSD